MIIVKPENICRGDSNQPCKFCNWFQLQILRTPSTCTNPESPLFRELIDSLKNARQNYFAITQDLLVRQLDNEQIEISPDK